MKLVQSFRAALASIPSLQDSSGLIGLCMSFQRLGAPLPLRSYTADATALAAVAGYDDVPVSPQNHRYRSSLFYGSQYQGPVVIPDNERIVIQAGHYVGRSSPPPRSIDEMKLFLYLPKYNSTIPSCRHGIIVPTIRMTATSGEVVGRTQYA